MSLQSLRNKWDENCADYKTSEVGSGVHSFIADALESDSLFALKKTAKKTGTRDTFVHDTESTKAGRPDFIIYISGDVTIPIEAKCYTRIEEGVVQLRRYQVGLDKQFGILTDGFEWRFYRGAVYRKFLLSDILDNPKDFLTFWKDYTRAENYYIELFNKSGQGNLFEDKIDLNNPESRKLFFEDTTRLVASFKDKMKGVGALASGVGNEKTAVETSYAYLIQFILYKVLVDNCYTDMREKYDAMMGRLKQYIKDKNLYTPVMLEVKQIAEYIARNIYRPFKKEQESITEKLFHNISKTPTIDDVAPWLDIIAYIDKYSFANLKNEIFGFVYENYLKDLYHDKNKGQYFTDPAVVNFMLEEMGYDEPQIQAEPQNISIVDPSCGAGTFLYSAVDRIISAIDDNTQQASERIEELIDKNVFGLDIEEFPLYLAEMSILMQLLPLIVNDLFQNPIESKFKIFKTKDSIAEFLDTGIGSDENEIDLFSHLQSTALDYPSFMRDEKDLQEMLESMQNTMGCRRRFDYVVGNPPYVGLNKCYDDDAPFTLLMRLCNKDGSPNQNKTLDMNDVYGVNLHSIPNKPKKGRPNPNLYVFFIALGLALLKDGGRLCYIIPQNLLTAGDLDVLRYHLSKFTTIEKIITFGGKLFIGRGLRQTRSVATSSLILVVRKVKPRANHSVKFVNYDTYTEKQVDDFAKYLRSRNKTSKTVLQSDLLHKVSSWNFIKQDDEFQTFFDAYHANTDDIAIYYDHKQSKSRFQTAFWFDGGYSIDEKQIKPEKGDYIYPKIRSGYSTLKDMRGYWDNIRGGKTKQAINLRQGNQGYNLLDSHYKVVWSYANTKHFYYTNKRIIWARNQFNAIGSDNRKEVLYLFSLLNAPINKKLLMASLKSENEKDMLVSLSSIKQYIRVPKITPKNQAIKDEIIRQTEAMLAFEDVKLSDVVNFASVRMQKFSNVSVVRNKLVLEQGETVITVSIPSDKTALVQAVVQDLPAEQMTLSHLKNLEAIDFAQQSQIKDYIDALVFALYFQVPLRNISFDVAGSVKTACRKNEFYEIVHGERKRIRERK